MMRRWLAATVIGIVAGVLCYRYQLQFGRGAGDFGWSLHLVHDLLSGRNPYSYPPSVTPSAYPLTAAVIAAPFVWLPPTIAAGLFFGLSSGFLALGLTQNGTWWRLLVFAAYPFWAALMTVQWSPLLFAVALYPAWLPLALAKPHIALPVLLTRLSWRRIVTCALFGLLTIAIYPSWPWEFLHHQGAPGQYLPPIAVLPLGPLLLLGLLQWRTTRGKLFMLLASVPQRLWYDSLLVWLIPETAREMFVLVLGSWIAYLGWYRFSQWGSLWLLIGIYLPALGLVFGRPFHTSGRRYNLALSER